VKKLISTTINGEQMELAITSGCSLLDSLRIDVNLTGSKKGCDVGECGACTIIMNNKAVCACLVAAAEADGAVIETIEGLQPAADTPHLIQEKFMEYGASQCGFCTPGFIMMSRELLDQNPDPTTDQVRFALSGNICRCTGYTKIIDAVMATAEAMRDVAPQ
jgi:carbon-monoxide dehydrogenase small subunit